MFRPRDWKRDVRWSGWVEGWSVGQTADWKRGFTTMCDVRKGQFLALPVSVHNFPPKEQPKIS